jgi:hypothetical protein
MNTTPAASDAPEAPPSPTVSRRRRAVVWTLLALATLVGLVSALTLWVDRQALDNASWKTTSQEVVRDPAVRAALSNYLVDQLYANVDVAGEVRRQLPPDAKVLAGPATAALRQPATDAVERLLARPRMEALFVKASSDAQQKAINVVEDDTGAGITTGNGVVTLELAPLVTTLGNDLGVPDAALAKIPADAGTITVMRSDELKTAQAVVRGIHALNVLLVVLMLGLFTAAVLVARGFRRQTLRAIGWSFLGIGIGLLLLRKAAGSYVIEALVSPQSQDAGHSVWAIGTSELRDIGQAAVLYGLFLIAAATLAGPSVAATAVRRWMAPVLNSRPAVAWGTATVAFLALVLWGPTHALRTPGWILVLAALAAVAVLVLRRQVRREFPDAAVAPGASIGSGTVAAMRSAGARAAQATRPQQVQQDNGGAAAHPATGNGGSAAQEIERLGGLRDAGLITDDEFDRGKTRALA